MKENILIAFQNLGFIMQEIGTIGYAFTYEDINFIWLTDEDESFLNVAIPAVIGKKGVDELDFYQALDKINSTLKYIKANELNDSIWLFYEREMFENDDFETVLKHGIYHLEHAFNFIHDGSSDDEPHINPSSDIKLIDESN